MIDNISLRTEYDFPEFIKLTEMLSVTPDLDSSKIRFKWQNLRISYYPNVKRLTIQNSMHKFFNSELNQEVQKPTNANGFSLINFNQLVSFLTLVLEKDAKQLEVFGKFEFGVNVSTGMLSPYNIISRYQSCGTTHINEFYTVPPTKGKPSQRNCNFSDWFIKGYDKGLESSLINVNLLRYEVVVTEKRKLRQILELPARISLSDISTENSWRKMASFLVDTYDRIRKIPIVNERIPLDEITSIYSYTNRLNRYDIKRNTDRRQFEQLNRSNRAKYLKWSNSDNNFHNQIRHEILSRSNQLTHGVSNFTTCSKH